MNVDLERETPGEDLERGLERVTSVGVVVVILAAIVAAATIWLMLTDPVTVANALDEGEISPLVLRLAEVLYNALAGLLDYL